MNTEKKLIRIIIILILILAVMLYFYFKEDTIVNQDTSSTNTTISNSEVIRTDIKNTLSSKGEVFSSLTENLKLHATYYLSEVYVSENQEVQMGENILMYSNGTYMTAPYNLVITELNIPEIGSVCSNSNYISVETTESLYINLSIDEDDLSLVNLGDEVEISLTAFPDNIYKGYITKINEIGSGSSFNSVVTFENPGEIKIGMSASCEIILEKALNVLAVPIEAVITTGNDSYVVYVYENTTKEVTVETGISNDAYIEIISGLEEGDIVQITQEDSTSSKKNMNIQFDNMQNGDQNFGEKNEGGDPPEMPNNF